MAIARKRLKKANGALPRKRETPAWVKEAADRAEALSKGEDPYKEPVRARRKKQIVESPPPLEEKKEPKRKVERKRMIGSTTKNVIASVSTPNKTTMRLAATYDPETYPERAAQLVLNGATDRDLAVEFQVTGTVLRSWMNQYPEFAAACIISKDASLADAKVERSVYEMANGYSIPAVKIMHYKGEVIKVPYRKHIPKDINAAKYWLMNRDPTKWGRGSDSNNNNDDKTPSAINVNMIRGMNTEQLRQMVQVLKSVMSPNQALSRLDEMKTINNDMVLDAEVEEVKDEESET